MYTPCPSCKRVFPLKAEHLSVAEGMVRCGFCNTAFNALENLYDEPPPVPPVLTGSGEAGEEEAMAQGEGAAPIEDLEPELPPVEVLLQEDWHHRSVRPFWKWILGLLIAALLIQAAWHFRSELITRFPGLAPWVHTICTHLDCLMLRQGRLSDVVLLNRDVRTHPVYQDTVLVNATLRNESQVALPYPVMQLQLYDNRQTILAYREFAPEEYLDRNASVSWGMLPGVPVHLVLELTGPVKDATGFEFGFAYLRSRPFFAR